MFAIKKPFITLCVYREHHIPITAYHACLCAFISKSLKMNQTELFSVNQEQTRPINSGDKLNVK